jgi:hypothetical protein
MFGSRTNYDGMIAAGGFARRMSAVRIERPKSLMIGSDRPVVLAAAESAIRAGCEKVLILNNRPEWNAFFLEIFSNCSKVHVMQDVGYPSTFLLCQRFSSLMKQRFLFLYGHAPRPVEHLKKFAKLDNPNVASAFQASTKRNVIIHGAFFLEPPYVIDRETIQSSSASDWASYFNEHKVQTGYYFSDGPAEPNTRIEFSRYVAHYSL